MGIIYYILWEFVMGLTWVFFLFPTCVYWIEWILAWPNGLKNQFFTPVMGLRQKWHIVLFGFGPEVLGWLGLLFLKVNVVLSQIKKTSVCSQEMILRESLIYITVHCSILCFIFLFVNNVKSCKVQNYNYHFEKYNYLLELWSNKNVNENYLYNEIVISFYTYN